MNATSRPRAANRLEGLILLSLGLLAAGCETAPLVIDRKSDADIEQFHSFALLPLPHPGSERVSARALQLAQVAREAAVSTLTSKGFTEAATNNADFLVRLQGQSLPKGPVAPVGFGATVLTGRGATPVYDPDSLDAVTYDERTLRVEVFDNRTREMVWSGWTRKLSSRPTEPEQIEKAVRRILSKFPSAAGSAARQP
jgi:hypothetical protein